ncbi:MAG: response regulator [Bacteroidetes bacterium]|nr:response regulator [Bacteroidota bacterium]
MDTKEQRNNNRIFTIYGALLGLTFPVFAIAFLVINEGYSASDFGKIHGENHLLYIIWLAPIVLGIAGYICGRLNTRIKKQIALQDSIIAEQTQQYKDKNEQLSREIEERKLTEKQLILAKEDAERAKRAEELFLANMSHELRTPLNGVVGFTRLLLGTTLTKEQNEFVSTVQDSANHLLAVINDILEISKIKAGEMEFESIPISTTKVVMTAVNTFKVMASNKSVALYEEIDSHIPPYVMGDQTRLNQVLLNLINNALKFTHDGFVVVKVQLLSEDTRKVRLKFSVQDSGIGISEDRLKDIFSDFKQADASVARKYGGTGLGLSICKNMVELQGGKIYVESVVNVGSSFHFELEFKKTSIIKTPEDSTGAFEPKDLGNVNLLLVEDNKINVKLAENVLKKWGGDLRYQIASNGQEAVDLHEKENFDIILMDLQMPVMDGFEATEYIRKELPAPQCQTPIIALTADVMASEKSRAFDLGINDYITKPFDANKLFATIAKFVK